MREPLSTKVARHLRSHLLAYAGLFLALTLAPAWAASQRSEPTATSSASSGKKIKKLKQQLSSVEARLAALEAGAGSPSPPSGAAGGDLTGSYPDPTIAGNAVGTSEVDGTLTAADIANTSSLGTNEINESDLDLVQAPGAAITMSRELLTSGLSYTAGNPATFTAVGSAMEVRSRPVGFQANLDFCNVRVGGSPEIDAIAYTGGTFNSPGTRTFLELDPGECNELDVNGASIFVSDFQLYSPVDGATAYGIGGANDVTYGDFSITVID